MSKDGNAKGSTKAARAVLDLQRRLPNARVVYVSATGASELRHMTYMEVRGASELRHMTYMEVCAV